MLNDHVLMYYHFVPYVISYFRHFCIFTLWVGLYKPPQLCNPMQLFINTVSRSFHFRVSFSLLSLLFLSFSRLLNTPLEDDNSRDAWLSHSLEEEGCWLGLGATAGCPLALNDTGTAFMVPYLPN